MQGPDSRKSVPSSKRRGPRRSKKDAPGPPLAETVLQALEPLYGPMTWAPRYEPVPELVFTILSQHTSDLNAERAFGALRDRFGTMEQVAEAAVQEIQESIAGAGLSRVKAPRIKEALQEIQRRLGVLDLTPLKELPLEEAKAWMSSLPGVGPKSAAVVLCFALGMPAMAVDTHVHRVARRLGLIGEKTTAEQAHPLLEAMVPPEKVYAFHVALITHGRRVCKARRPLCEECVLSAQCPSSSV